MERNAMRVAVDGLWSAGMYGPCELVFEDGVLRGLEALGSGTVDARAALALPLLSDLQVNGGGGVMVNSTPTAQALREIAAAHRRLGTGDILPTVITDRAEVIEAAAEAAIEAAGDTGVLGLHIEGPHLAMARRGTHNPAFIRPLDGRTVAVVRQLRGAGVPVMITLAPELADPALLAELVASGAVVSAGHSAATAEEARAGFAAGISCVTHLYNAMEQMRSRAPGLLGAAINSRAHCGLICDGIHVDWDMLRIALRGRPAPGLCFAVSDAMATVGGPESFVLYGEEIRVRDGRLVNAEGALAGAHVDLRTSLANLVRQVGLPLAEAVAMVTDIPRRVMGLGPRLLRPGTALDDMLLLDESFRPIPL